MPLSPWEKFTELIKASSGMIAILDGVDVDSGTASEIGYGSALGLVISGVRSDLRRANENDGTQVNLQVDYFVRHTGGHVHRSHEAAISELAALLLP